MATNEVPRERKRPNAIYLFERVQIGRRPADTYRFLTTMVPDRYREMAKGHECFEVRGGGDLVEGCVIDCHERAGNQEVRHAYEVRQLVPDERIHYASAPTRTRVHLKSRTIEGTGNTHVYYDLAPGPFGSTELAMTIVIELPNIAQKLLATLGRARRIWGDHQREELAMLAGMVEAMPAV